jgi:hypothetical protein
VETLFAFAVKTLVEVDLFKEESMQALKKVRGDIIFF